jgi:hypothetical protein
MRNISKKSPIILQADCMSEQVIYSNRFIDFAACYPKVDFYYSIRRSRKSLAGFTQVAMAVLTI